MKDEPADSDKGVRALVTWIQRNYFRKIDHASTTRGAQDANRPLALSALGYLNAVVLSGIATLTGLFVDGVLRVRQSGSTRYRSDYSLTAAHLTINAYDDTGAVYLPIFIDCTYLQVDGNLGEAWNSLSYTNSGGTTWADFGGGYGAGQYKKVGDMVFLRGLAKRTAGAGNIIGVLPALYRPTATQMYSILTDTGLGQIDVKSDGTINKISGGAGFTQLNLPPFSIV